VSSDGELRLAQLPGGEDVLSDLLWVTAPFAAELPGPGGTKRRGASDGMIAVESAKWGDFRGCVPADHYDVIGQIGDRGPDPISGFDAANFYVNIAADLERKGL
ncbi:MAG: hypothetical protein KDC14_13380, partial [Planctomycetes bacterium]|nr:hypothetical protein [Planctomycetota bacterium]